MQKKKTLWNDGDDEDEEDDDGGFLAKPSVGNKKSPGDARPS
jgi:hypothetical protein